MMKTFIVLFAAAALAAAYHVPAPLNKDGTVADLPEVAVAKLEHYAKLAKAGGAVPHGHYGYVSYAQVPQWEETHLVNDEHSHRYHGPPAPLNHDGTVAETPEVRHVKQERLAALAEAFAKAPRYYSHQQHLYKRSVPVYYGHYYGPPAPLNHDGTVDETPEVKAAKSALSVAYAKAGQGTAGYPSAYYPYSHYEPAPLNHDGTVADTPEVQHAKSIHFAAHAKVQSSYPYGQTYNQHYHVPAPLNHDGTVAETEEVHARRIEHLAAHHKALVNLG